MKETNPKGVSTGSSCVCRGGGWSSNAVNLVVSNHLHYTPGYRLRYLSFRPVCNGGRE